MDGFINLIHLLRLVTNIGELNVGDILDKLLSTEGRRGVSPQLAGLVNNAHISSWSLLDLTHESLGKREAANPTSGFKMRILNFSRM